MPSRERARPSRLCTLLTTEDVDVHDIQVRPRVFSKKPPADFAFGMTKSRDPEGAKDGESSTDFLMPPLLLSPSALVRLSLYD